jgi:hypothetical protein
MGHKMLEGIYNSDLGFPMVNVDGPECCSFLTIASENTSNDGDGLVSRLALC